MRAVRGIPIRVLATATLLVVLSSFACAADLSALEQQAFQAAVERIAPSVVRIETVGGMERAGEALVAAGPTTGLVVDADGYILTSTLGLEGQPDSILVRLSDGRRRPARRVADDTSRQLVLLKIDVEAPLSVPEMAPRESMRVGQWTIAVGRTFEADRPNMAVGILSATNRVWGKAIQTDAATSPSNYGGPLVDIHGRVLGLIVPLAPEADEPVGGTQWYDSGVGFAVPAEDFLRVLPRLKAGENLRPGRAGFSLAPGEVNVIKPVIVACRPGSPAALAGLAAGDEIVQVDDRPISRSAELIEELGRRYAGQRVALTVRRDGDRLARELVLADALPPYEHPFLGVFPVRSLLEQDDAGVRVRWVWAGSPAQAAGIEPKDQITAIDGKPIKDAEALRKRMAQYLPGQSVSVELRRGGKPRSVSVVLGRMPEEPPGRDWPPTAAPPAPDETGAPRGKVALKAPEVANDAWAYVPAACGADWPCGVVVWLAAPGEGDDEELLRQWKALCDRHGLILLVPKPTDPARWLAAEETAIVRLRDELTTRYVVDPDRVAVAGHEGGATMAYRVALAHRGAVRGVCASSGALLLSPPPNDPAYRQAFFVAASTQPRDAARAGRAVSLLRGAQYPVTVCPLGPVPRPFTPEELAELARWIDALDRI